MMPKLPGFPSARTSSVLLFGLIVAGLLTLAAVMGLPGGLSQEIGPSGTVDGAARSAVPRTEASPGAPSGSHTTTSNRNAQSPAPRALLEEALRILERRRSVAARIRQEIDLFDKRLVGSGTYLEQHHARNPRDAASPQPRSMRLVRMELKIQHGDQVSSLVQVASPPDPADRRFLWTKRKVLEEERLSRIDLDRVARELDASKQDMAPIGPVGVVQAEGGLAKILQGLHDCFNFADSQLGKMGSQGQLVWRIQGRWKPEMLARAVGKPPKEGEKAQPIDPSRLPPHLPDRVVLHLRHQDLFPLRIEYHRTAAESSAEPKSRAMVTMEFYDVVVDRPIPIQRFVYNPGDLEYDDETTEYIESRKGEE